MLFCWFGKIQESKTEKSNNPRIQKKLVFLENPTIQKESKIEVWLFWFVGNPRIQTALENTNLLKSQLIRKWRTETWLDRELDSQNRPCELNTLDYF